MKIKPRSLIEYAVTFSVFAAAQLLLLLAKTPFCTGLAVVITVSTFMTMLITKRYAPGAVFAAMCLIPDFLIAAPGMHALFYVIAAVPALLMFGIVFGANRLELGLLFSDILGIFAGYFPYYLAVKHIMPNFAEEAVSAELISIAGLPMLSGFLIAAVITFFAVPAANVITRDGF